MQIDYATLVARVQAAVEREIENLEAQPREHGSAAAPRGEDPERRARRLASLSRTLRELCALRAADEHKPDSVDDDALPRDIDEFRRDLARKVDAIIARRTAAPVREPEAE